MFHIVANNTGLDLVNTQIVDGGKPVDLLKGFGDLVDWSLAAGVVTKSEAAALIKRWKGSAEADRVYESALQLRDSIKQIAEDLSHGQPVADSALSEVNRILKKNSGFFEVRREGDSFSKSFHSEYADIAGLLVPVAESVADLLCFGDLAQVRKCENEACVLHFYDTSKNHRRRWCSMAECGNRAKASAFYRRHKAA